MSSGISNVGFGLKSLSNTQRLLGNNFRNLASGLRINRASQDAAGLAISETLRSLVGGAEQGVRNLSDGVSATRIAEGALDETSNQLIRLRELNIQSSNGTLSDPQRQIIQDEADQITQEISRTSQTTNFNGRSLLDGSTSGADSLNMVDGSGGGDISVSVDDMGASALGVEGIDISDSSSLASIDDAIRRVSSTRAGLGSAQNRMESTIRNLRVGIENTSAANSRIRDTDFASETSKLAKNQVLTRAGIAVKLQANLQASSVLQLLGRAG